MTLDRCKMVVTLLNKEKWKGSQFMRRELKRAQGYHSEAFCRYLELQSKVPNNG